jgi:hypothetical protein
MNKLQRMPRGAAHYFQENLSKWRAIAKTQQKYRFLQAEGRRARGN